MSNDVKSLVFRCGGRDYNLHEAFPLTLGDWETLETLGIMTGGTVEIGTAKATIDLLHTLVHKIDSTVTRDMVKAVPLPDLVDLNAVLQGAVTPPGGAENPTAPNS